MATYLMTWNPRRFRWTALPKVAASVHAGEDVHDRWSCGRRVHIEPGSRLFLLRQGAEPRGILASGWATSRVFQDDHWDTGKGGLANYVRLRYDALLDPEADDLLPRSELCGGALADVRWDTQVSGIEISAEAADALERLWASHVGGAVVPYTEDVAAVEGEPRRRLITHYRREHKLRGAKLEEATRRSNGKLVCEVPGCGFDFQEAYGGLGAGYAHVHHLDPLGSRGVSTTRLNRLIVVCANCHAMIHRGGQCRDFRSLIERRQDKQPVS